MSEKIPKGWKWVKLGEEIEIMGGGTPKTNKLEYWNGNISWLTIADFNNVNKYVYEAQKTITELGLSESSTKLLKPGDIIISARGTIGAIAVLKKEMAFNQSCYGIRSKSDKIYQDFLYYLLKNSINTLLQNSYGAVFDTITRETFSLIFCLLPPLPEQKAIAEVLSSIDDKIDLLHRQNKTLEEMAMTLFRQWFIEPTKDGLPEGWKMGYLADEFDITMGQSPPGETLNEEKIGMVFFQGGSDFCFRFPVPRVYTTAPTRIAKPLDTLVSVRAPVGDINMAFEECCLGRGVAAFRYKQNPEFYSYTYYKMRSLTEQIKLFEDNGTVFGSIGKENFKKLDCFIPPIEMILKFEKNSKPFDDKIISNTKQIRTLEKLRDTLLPKLMSGEVRVKV